MTACVLCRADLDAAPVVNRIARFGHAQTSVACPRCALVQVTPMPTADEFTAYYASGEYRDEFPLRDENTADLDEHAKIVVEAEGITSATHVHEVGCGDGRFAAALVRVAGCRVTVEDADPAMCEAARARGLEVVHGGPADLIVSCQVLEHLPDPVAMLRDWRERAPRVRVEVPTVEKPYGGLSYFFQKPHVTNWSPATLAIAMLVAGLRPRTETLMHVLVASGQRTEPASIAEALAVIPHASAAEVVTMLATYAARSAQVPPAVLLSRWQSGASVLGMSRDVEAQLRDESRRATEVASEALLLFLALEKEAASIFDSYDDAWSEDAHTRGYIAGRTAAMQRIQMAAGHAANELRRMIG